LLVKLLFESRLPGARLFAAAGIAFAVADAFRLGVAFAGGGPILAFLVLLLVRIHFYPP